MHGGNHQGETVYRHLLIMTVLSYIAMFVLMYAMVDRFANVYPNLNQFYMAGLMTAPMVLIEIVLMGMMYKNKKVNIAIVTAAIVVLGACWLLIREQTGVGDAQFLRSMIPHHAGAILMCEKAPIVAPEIKKLCGEIIASQQAEIAQMKTILSSLEK